MTRVAVIGAGIIGLAVAYELGARGISVVVIDPRSPGSAASDGNTGWIAPTLSGPVPAPGLPRQVAVWMGRRDSPFRIDLRSSARYATWLYQFWRNCNQTQYDRGLRAIGSLNAHAVAGFERWREEGLEFEQSRSGVLFVAEDPHSIEHLIDDVEALSSFGYEPIHWVSGTVLRDLEPALAPDISTGIFASCEEHVRAETLIESLLHHLRQSGVEFIEGAVDDSIEETASSTFRIRLEPEIVDAEALVIATGAWTGSVARLFGLDIPIVAGKGYSVTIESPGLRLQQPLYLADAKIACSPFVDVNRFAGMMELTIPDDTIDPGRLAVMSTALDRYLPGWNQGVRRIAWVGPRPMTPDGLPVIGKAPDLANVYIASGHGMLGITMAPVTGEIIADLITEGHSRQEIHAFDPGRF